ncbi:hypothetical protein IMSHALPRED_007544 [Imshaugia aleurites]|uniref:Rhodopsin domain-containing protein n=1 Tax=Imshaugia aleurites TaxID=172621 RepID=A0A8H3EU63_9LECA|nr:hypothetical protein IMSHALPRED_007544 [Imshaugia aleurites]
MAIKESKAKVITLSVVLPAFATTLCLLRLRARSSRKHPLKEDDYFILLSLILAWAEGITLILGACVGNYGQHTAVGPGGKIPDNFVTFEDRHTEYAIQVIETLTFGAIKLSVLFFYRRLFVGRPFNFLSWGLIATVLSWSIGFFFATVFECHPISAAWGTREQLYTECVKTHVKLDAFVISDPALDAIILALPMPFVWQLRLPMRRKLALTGVFLLGALSIGAGVTRCVFLFAATTKAHTDPDVAYLILPTLYWSIIEASLNIVAACLPTLGPLVADFSVQSAVRSVRSAISLHSIRSRGSSISKHSNGSGTAKPRHTQLEADSISSATAMHPAFGLDTYPPNAVETQAFAETEFQERNDATHFPKNRIMLENAVEGHCGYV